LPLEMKTRNMNSSAKKKFGYPLSHYSFGCEHRFILVYTDGGSTHKLWSSPTKKYFPWVSDLPLS